MTDYIIYKITIGDNSYVGSTKNYDARIAAHISAARSGNNKSRLYLTAGGCADFMQFEVLERVNTTRAEILKIEAGYIRIYNSNLNMIMPYRSQEEKRIQVRKHHLKAFNTKEICMCGRFTDKNHHSEHRKSKTHKLFIEEKLKTDPTFDINNTFTII
jgi:hypothetical protein